jgi:hypothetical protein
VEARTHDGRSLRLLTMIDVHPAVPGNPGGPEAEQLSRDRDTG